MISGNKRISALIRRIVIFLVRIRLGLKTYEHFRFVGQKSNAMYCFTEDSVLKKWHGNTEKSGVSINWLLDDKCKIEKVVIG